MNEYQGKCLCGAVEIRAQAAGNVGACHCSICRRWCGGGPMFAVHAEGQPVINGEESISRYQSSEFAERGFCSRCGSNLFYHLKPGQFSAEGAYMLAAGFLELPVDMAFDNEIFIDSQPDWYRFNDAASRTRMTEKDPAQSRNSDLRRVGRSHSGVEYDTLYFAVKAFGVCGTGWPYEDNAATACTTYPARDRPHSQPFG